MTGELHGTNHSATARSNERAARQQRHTDAIDARHNGELTFSGVLKELKAHSQLTEADGHYTAQLHASNQKAILSMLGKVNAEITAFGITSMIVEFKAPHIVHDDVCEICGVVGQNFVERENVIVCPEHAKPLALANMHNVLMLSAPPEVLMLPAKTGISIGDKIMLGETQHEIRHYGAEIYTRYNSRTNHRYEIACYTQAQIAVFDGGIARLDETAKRAQATLCPPPEPRRSMYTSQREMWRRKAEEMAATMPRRNATPEEIEAIQKIGREQGATARKHNAIKMDIVGQTERGTDVKRPRFSVGGQMA